MNDSRLHSLLDGLQAGTTGASQELLHHCLERLRLLAARMFRPLQDLRVLHQTDDVLQRALVRLHRALQSVHPGEPRAFFGLAARQIRWVLRDMAQEVAKHRLLFSDARLDDVAEPAAATTNEGVASDWAELHRLAEDLSEEERETLDLLVYQGLSQEEAAHVLGISVRTVKRRWQRVRILLHAQLMGKSTE